MLKDLNLTLTPTLTPNLSSTRNPTLNPTLDSDLHAVFVSLYLEDNWRLTPTYDE